MTINDYVLKSGGRKSAFRNEKKNNFEAGSNQKIKHIISCKYIFVGDTMTRTSVFRQEVFPLNLYGLTLAFLQHPSCPTHKKKLFYNISSRVERKQLCFTQQSSSANEVGKQTTLLSLISFAGRWPLCAKRNAARKTPKKAKIFRQSLIVKLPLVMISARAYVAEIKPKLTLNIHSKVSVRWISLLRTIIKNQHQFQQALTILKCSLVKNVQNHFFKQIFREKLHNTC